MNHKQSDAITVFCSQLGSNIWSGQWMLGIAILIFFVLWTYLAGCPLSLAGFLLLSVFIAAGSLWTIISQLSWPSRSSCLAYYPIGFGISTGFCTLFLLARLGLVCSTLLAMLLGLVCCVFALGGHWSLLVYPVEKVKRFAPVGLLASGMALLSLLTFLFLSQLQSVSTLATLSDDTTLLAWSDYIAHARTTLEISSASLGELPQSSLGSEIRLAPYHYGHYILPALLLSQGLSVSSLQAYTALAPVFGAFLLLAPVFERFRLAGIRSIAESLSFLFVAILTYATWVHFASDTFVDPIWLLIAGPGTMYAGAVLIGLLQIFVTRADCIDARRMLSLLAVIAVLLLLYKVHLVHSFFIFLILLAVKSLSLDADQSLISGPWAWLRRRPNRYLVAVAAGALFFGMANLLLRMSRQHLLKDFAANALKFTEYFTGLKFDSYAVLGFHLSVLDISYLLACASFGLLVMVGPLYGIAILLSRLPSLEHERKLLRVDMPLLLFSLLGSLLIAVFFAPEPSWWADSSEFQNRVWPVLWCIALWCLAGLRLPLDSRALRQCVLALQVSTLIGAICIIPPSKFLAFSASTTNNQAYPIVIPLSVKSTAAQLKTLPKEYRFFAWKAPFTSRDNEWYVLVLSAASGRLPLYALPNYQLSKGNPTIRTSWDAAMSRSLSACIQQPGISSVNTLHSRVALVEQGGSQFAAVCP